MHSTRPASPSVSLLQTMQGDSLGSSLLLSESSDKDDDDLVLFHQVHKTEKAAVLKSSPQAIAPHKSRIPDDIFSSSDWDKNDFDWLMTPPAESFIPNLDQGNILNGLSSDDTMNTPSRVEVLRSATSSVSESSPNSVHDNLDQFPPLSVSGGLSISTKVVSRRPLSSSVKSTSTPTSKSSRPSTPTSKTSAQPSTPNAKTIGRPSTPNSKTTARPSTPTSRVTGRPSTPTSKSSGRPLTPSSATRPSTPNRISSRSTSSTIATSRPSTPNRASAAFGSSPNTSLHPSTPTRHSTTSIRPFTSTGHTSGRSTPPSYNSVSTSRSSTPIKRLPTPPRTSNKLDSTARSSIKAASLVSKSATSSRPSSPTTKSKPPVTLAASLPGFSEEAPPNLRTSMPNRSLSNPRGSVTSRSTVVTVSKSIQQEAPEQIKQLSSSAVVTRGVNTASEKSGCKMTDRTSPSNKSMVLPKAKPGVTRESKSTPVRESTGFGRNISKKSLDMALRHMDIRNGTPNAVQSFMSNIPTSSLYSVRSSKPRGLSPSLPPDTAMTTSSTASSERSVSVVIDPECVEAVDESMSDKGSRASPVSQLDPSFLLSSERRVNSWLGSPGFMDDDNGDIMQTFAQEIEKMSGTESPLFSQQDATIEFDDFNLDPVR